LVVVDSAKTNQNGKNDGVRYRHLIATFIAQVCHPVKSGVGQCSDVLVRQRLGLSMDPVATSGVCLRSAHVNVNVNVNVNVTVTITVNIHL